jgi:predicted transcriptional regulator
MASSLWSAATGGFDGPALRRAIVARGWTVPEFARAARMNSASLYNALRGRRVRDSTAIRIFDTLEKRSPMGVALEVA